MLMAQTQQYFFSISHLSPILFCVLNPHLPGLGGNVRDCILPSILALKVADSISVDLIGYLVGSSSQSHFLRQRIQRSDEIFNKTISVIEMFFA